MCIRTVQVPPATLQHLNSILNTVTAYHHNESPIRSGFLLRQQRSITLHGHAVRPDGAVCATRHHIIPGPCYTQHLVCVALKSVQRHRSAQVPQLHCLVVGGCRYMVRRCGMPCHSRDPVRVGSIQLLALHAHQALSVQQYDNKGQRQNCRNRGDRDSNAGQVPLAFRYAPLRECMWGAPSPGRRVCAGPKRAVRAPRRQTKQARRHPGLLPRSTPPCCR